MIVHDSANRVVSLEIGGQRCALRMPKLDDAQLNVDRRSELAAIKAAAAAGLAPEVLAFDVESGAMITRWIDAPVWTQEQARDPERIAFIGTTLRRLHDLPPPSDVRVLDLAAQLNGYRDNLHKQGKWPVDFDARQAEALETLSKQPVVPRRLCHNDLHSGNLIGTGTHLRLLDWEYSGLGNPLFDVASYARSNDLADEQVRLLLDSYGASEDTRHRFKTTAKLFDWVCMLWSRLAQL